MTNYDNELYNYLQRKVTVLDERRSSIELREHYQNLKQYQINAQTYFSFSPPTDTDEPQPDMGCSEKIVLFSEKSMLDAIENECSPKPCALLKLPKHNNIKQVQSEAMALGLSREVFGLTTTDSSMVTYDNKPALFIPFEDMQPLTEIASGKSDVRKDGKPAFEGSTINPLGNGLVPNLFLEDFGQAFGLMYLCGDPDAVGRQNQNKGFIGRNLYIFDQAIFNNEYPVYFDLFYLDSRLCQTPSTKLGGKLRHTRGRNFSLIEDASFEDKFESLNINRQQEALRYCDKVIAGLTGQKEFESVQQGRDIQALIESAQKTKRVIEGRISRYQQMLPRAENISQETLKNALIFEKILNNPKLYTDIGRPYRNLMTTSPHKLKIKEIISLDNDMIKISFNQKLDVETRQRIIDKFQKKGVQVSISGKSLVMPKSLLNNLEKAFYPEIATEIDPEINYLSIKHIETLCETYAYKNPRLINIFKNYERMTSSEIPPEKLANIILSASRFSRQPETNRDIPFYQHLIKCFEFDAQQKLQNSLRREFTANSTEDHAQDLIDKQNSAFSTAVKLDCMMEFNHLCTLYAKNLGNPELVARAQELFERFSIIDTQDMTIENATELRKEFSNQLKSLVMYASTTTYRNKLQDLKQDPTETDENIDSMNSNPKLN